MPGTSKQYGCLHRHFLKPNKNIVSALIWHHNNGRVMTKCHGFCKMTTTQPPKLKQYFVFPPKTAELKMKRNHTNWWFYQVIKVNPFPNKPWFLGVCSASLLKTRWKKDKLLVTSNLSFSHSVFYLYRKLSAIFVKFKIVVCKLFQFGRV